MKNGYYMTPLDYALKNLIKREISLPILQRRLQIGFPRAVKILEGLKERGCVEIVKNNNKSNSPKYKILNVSELKNYISNLFSKRLQFLGEKND